MMTAFNLRDLLTSKIRKTKDILALVLLAIIVRLPRSPGIIGSDAFVVLWSGHALSEGFWDIWTISPVSLFGLHPYTSGAICVPLLIAIMIRIGLSYEGIVLIVSMAVGVIGTLSAYALGAELFKTKQGSFFFALFYSFSHLFLRFTYYTISLRGPLLAVLPLFLLYSVRTLRTRDSQLWVLTSDGLSLVSQRARRYAALSTMLFLILLLIHGLAIFLTVYAGVVIGYYILRSLKNTIRRRWRAATREEAFGPERHMSVEELTLPLRTREEILASYAWLKDLQEWIPKMDVSLLMTAKEELSTAHELYSKSFRADEIMASMDSAGARLEKVFLERIELVISQVGHEIESKSLDEHVRRVIENPGSSFSSDLSRPTSEESDPRHSNRILRLFGGRLEFRMSLSGFGSWVLFLLLMGGAYFIGIQVMPTQAAKTASLLGFSNESLLGLSINLVADYGIRLGLMSLFFPVGILGAFHMDRGRDKRIVHYLLLPMVMVTLPMSTYASVLFLPVFGYYSVVGLSVIWDSFNTRWMGIFSLAFVLAFGLSYQLIVVLLPSWILVLIASIVIFSLVAIINWLRKWYSYQTLIGKTLRRWKSVVGQGPTVPLDKLGAPIFLLSVIIISLMTTEGLLLQDENACLSDDEKRIIDFLDTQLEPGITVVPTPVIGRRLEAYGFPAVLSYNDAAALYFGWPDPNNVTFRFSPWDMLRTGSLYVTEGRTPEKVIWNQVAGINLTNPTEYEFAKEVGIEFVIVEKNATGYSDIFHSTYGETHFTLFYSAPLAGELVVDGQRMSLFRLT